MAKREKRIAIPTRRDADDYNLADKASKLKAMGASPLIMKMYRRVTDESDG